MNPRQGRRTNVLALFVMCMSGAGAVFLAGRASVTAGEPPVAAGGGDTFWSQSQQTTDGFQTLTRRMSAVFSSPEVLAAVDKIAKAGPTSRSSAGQELVQLLQQAQDSVKPIRGVDIIVEKNPGNVMFRVASGGQTFEYKNPNPFAGARDPNAYKVTMIVEANGVSMAINSQGLPTKGHKGTETK